MRIAVYTITRNRLDYTKRAFESLARKAGIEYSHYVYDNASTDGTLHYLGTQPVTTIVSDHNVGQQVAANALLDEIEAHDPSYDYIVRFDNDCFVESNRVLKGLVVASKRFADTAILSPH